MHPGQDPSDNTTANNRDDTPSSSRHSSSPLSVSKLLGARVRVSFHFPQPARSIVWQQWWGERIDPAAQATQQDDTQKEALEQWAFVDRWADH